jgi:hypothetical protein
MGMHTVLHESCVPDHATVKKPTAGFADRGAKESALSKLAIRRRLD